MHLIDSNNMVREQLEEIPIAFHGINEVPHTELVSMFVDRYEKNMELIWALRLKV